MGAFEVGGGATGAVLLLKGIEFGIAYLKRRGRSVPPTSIETKVAQAQSRSFSPGQMAAVTADRIAAAQTAREELVDRIETNNLLKRIADGVEQINESLNIQSKELDKQFETLEERIRWDLQTSTVCRAPGNQNPPPGRGRMPSRPGGE